MPRATVASPPLTAHPQFAELAARWEAGERGTALAAWLTDTGHPPATAKQIGDYFTRKRSGPATTSAITVGQRPQVTLNADGTGNATSKVFEEGGDTLSEEDLIRGWKLDPTVWGIEPGSLSVNRWVQNAELDTWCYQYKARLWKLTDIDAWTLTLPPPITVNLRTPARLPARRTTDLGVAVIYMDAQIGYWEDPESGELISIQDEAALDISLQITEYLDARHGIDYLIDIGDTGDNPVFSTRHASARAYQPIRAVNAANSRIARLWHERSACAPGAQGKVLRGNHDQRFLTYIEEKAPHLVGLRDPATGELLLTVDRLYGVSAAGWEMVGDSYDDSRFYLNHNTIVEHGKKAGKGVAAAYLAQEVNRFFGHTPWMQSSHRTVTTGQDPRTYIAAGGGGFMKVRGPLPPGIYTGRKEDGTPGRGDAPWQQGFWVASYDVAGELVPQAEQVLITDGWATFRGEVFRARCDAEGNLL